MPRIKVVPRKVEPEIKAVVNDMLRIESERNVEPCFVDCELELIPIENDETTVDPFSDVESTSSSAADSIEQTPKYRYYSSVEKFHFFKNVADIEKLEKLLPKDLKELGVRHGLTLLPVRAELDNKNSVNFIAMAFKYLFYFRAFYEVTIAKIQKGKVKLGRDLLKPYFEGVYEGVYDTGKNFVSADVVHGLHRAKAKSKGRHGDRNKA